MNRKVVLTDDGSSSIFSEDMQQHYHSHFGAMQESVHIFIEAGLCADTLSHLNAISILEIGFGTGLNALLTYFKAEELHKEIYYETIEYHPLTQHEVAQLNYPTLLPYPQSGKIFSTLHDAQWNKKTILSENFTLLKRQISAIGANYTSNTFDLVYFDAFSPESQPEMWTKEVFKSIYNSLKKEGILLTYCTKGSVQRIVKEIGFQIEKLPGPVGKREILRGKR